MPKYALQFIAGKYEGGSFVVPDDKEMFIGRATDVEVVLIEDMVSRRHARLDSRHGKLTLTDLGSTNGTFVNGERIEACELEMQDRVLVGTSMLRVVGAADVAGQTVEVNLRATHVADPAADAAPAPQPVDPGPPTRGELTEGALPTLLRDYADAEKDGALVLTLGDDQVTLALQNGALVHASLASDPQVTPLNALRHVLAWPEGEFALQPAEGGVPQSFSEATQSLLAEAERQNADSRRRYNDVWRDAPNIALQRPMRTPLRALQPERLDALQLALEWHTIEAVLEHAHHDDYALLQHLGALVEAGILTPTP